MNSVVTRLTSALADRYRVDRELGAGGMATVYLAHDLRHDRKVAIKVLRPELAAVIGAARFLTEIRTTANLQHPHILSLHDSGEAAGTVYYVMPFVEGESLRDRLVRERQLPIEDAIRIATEIADALQYAHERGVIHRDIKPENILLHGGHALVADFGIALAASTGGGARMTETGMSLGTPTYMSPEQAMGERTLDARTDVYALGCVVYEMLVGDPPFIGSTAQAIVAKVLTEKPAPIVAQRDRVPEHVESAVLQALEKLSADRFGSAREFSAALRDTTRTTSSAGRASASTSTVTGRWSSRLVGAALLMLGLVGGRYLAPSAASTTRSGAPVALSIALPDSQRAAFQGNQEFPGGHGSIAISRDAKRIAWVGTGPNGVRLYVRELDGYAIRTLAGTDGAFAPFFSLDGATLGYFSGGELRTVSLASGESRVVVRDVKEPDAATFLPDGRIIYTTQFLGGFMVTPDGSRESLMTSDSAPAPGNAIPSMLIRRPTASTDGRYLVVNTYGPITIQLFDVASRSLRLVTRARADKGSEAAGTFDGSSPKLIGNQLVWLNGNVLMSATIDRENARLTSEPRVVVSGVRGDINLAADYDIADDGTVAFLPGGDPTIGKLAWLDRSARFDTLPLPAADYLGWDIAPDGKRIVTKALNANGVGEFHVYDLLRGISTELPPRAPFSSQPEWTADGQHVMYSLAQSTGDVGAVIRVAADGGQAPDTLARGFSLRYAVSRDGKVVMLLLKGNPSKEKTSAFDFMSLWASMDGKPFAKLDRPANAFAQALSPDHRFLAYDLLVGREEVFVELFPSTGHRTQVSVEGGFEPTFSPRGDQLFFRNGRRIMVSSIAPGDPPVVGKPIEYVAADFADFEGRAWKLAPDGRFLVKLLPSAAPKSELRVMSGALTAGAGVRAKESRQPQ